MIDTLKHVKRKLNDDPVRIIKIWMHSKRIQGQISSRNIIVERKKEFERGIVQWKV